MLRAAGAVRDVAALLASYLLPAAAAAAGVKCAAVMRIAPTCAHSHPLPIRPLRVSRPRRRHAITESATVLLFRLQQTTTVGCHQGGETGVLTPQSLTFFIFESLGKESRTKDLVVPFLL